jgi:hypothetical protein
MPGNPSSVSFADTFSRRGRRKLRQGAEDQGDHGEVDEAVGQLEHDLG